MHVRNLNGNNTMDETTKQIGFTILKEGIMDSHHLKVTLKQPFL